MSADVCPHCGEPDEDPTPEPRIVWPCCGYVSGLLGHPAYAYPPSAYRDAVERGALDRDLAHLHAYQKANRTPGYVEASVRLRAYLRILATPGTPPEQVIAAIAAMSPDDRELVAAAVSTLRKHLGSDRA